MSAIINYDQCNTEIPQSTVKYWEMDHPFSPAYITWHTDSGAIRHRYWAGLWAQSTGGKSKNRFYCLLLRCKCLSTRACAIVCLCNTISYQWLEQAVSILHWSRKCWPSKQLRILQGIMEASLWQMTRSSFVTGSLSSPSSGQQWHFHKTSTTLT